MPVIKYDMSGVESQGDLTGPPPGLWEVKIAKAQYRGVPSNGAKTDVMFVFEVTEPGKHKGKQFATYAPPQADAPGNFKYKAIVCDVLGFPVNGSFNADPKTGRIAKFEGKSLVVRVDPDTYDDQYRARAGAFLKAKPVGAAEDEDEDEAEAEVVEDEVDLDAMSRTQLKDFIKEQELDITVHKGLTDEAVREAIADAMSGEEEESEEPEADEDEEEAEGEAVTALDAMNRDQLKSYIKDQGLGLRVSKNLSDDDIRARIREAEGTEEEEPEEEAEEEAEIDLDTMSRAELKAFIVDQHLDIRVTKSKSDDDLRTEIADALGDGEEEEPEEDEEENEAAEPAASTEDEYSDWSEEDLKIELGERKLNTKGSRKVLVARLVKDDAE